jgi:hypothetical protein
MIQLATDPNASRSFRTTPPEAKGASFENRRGRPGHAWPFLSRHGAQPARTEAPKAAAESGS